MHSRYIPARLRPIISVLYTGRIQAFQGRPCPVSNTLHYSVPWRDTRQNFLQSNACFSKKFLRKHENQLASHLSPSCNMSPPLGSLDHFFCSCAWKAMRRTASFQPFSTSFSWCPHPGYNSAQNQYTGSPSLFHESRVILLTPS